MAIWQFDLLLLPVGAAAPVPSEDGLMAEPVGAEAFKVAENLLTSRLGPARSMMEGWQVYGSDQGDRIDLLPNEDGSGELSARIDARAPDARFLELITELAHKLDCQLFSLEFGRAIEPSIAALRQGLSVSRAAAFVQDPCAVLRGAGDA